MTHHNNVLRQESSQFHGRTRQCLLKGCEKSFRPECVLQRYCGKSCQEAARAWSIKRSRERYRKTTKGIEHRREQSQRYRRNKKEHKTLREGDHPKINLGEICARPGCYERVLPTRRSPTKRYCCIKCYQAVRRVVEREKRWIARIHSSEREEAIC